MITPADIQAAIDVVTQLSNEADSQSVEDAVELIGLCSALTKASNDAKAMLEARALSQLEGAPRQIGDDVYMAKPDGKWRTDWAELRRKVLSAGLVSEEGEILRTKQQVAQRVYGIMMELFVSPSSQPKKGGLEAIRTELKEVSAWEKGKSKLVVQSVGAPE